MDQIIVLMVPAQVACDAYVVPSHRTLSPDKTIGQPESERTHCLHDPNAWLSGSVNATTPNRNLRTGLHQALNLMPGRHTDTGYPEAVGEAIQNAIWIHCNHPRMGTRVLVPQPVRSPGTCELQPQHAASELGLKARRPKHR